MKPEKRRRTKEKPFAAIEVTVVESEMWQKLKSTDAHVYNIVKTFYRGDGASFKAPFSLIKKRSCIKHSNTIDQSLHRLQEMEWLEITRYAKHGKGRGLRVRANEYRLTFKFDLQRW